MIFTFYNISEKGPIYSDLRNHRNLEGYSMFKDGFVTDVQAFGCDRKSKTENLLQGSNEGLPFYICWFIFCCEEDAKRVYSAFCSCRGGKALSLKGWYAQRRRTRRLEHNPDFSRCAMRKFLESWPLPRN